LLRGFHTALLLEQEALAVLLTEPMVSKAVTRYLVRLQRRLAAVLENTLLTEHLAVLALAVDTLLGGKRLLALAQADKAMPVVRAARQPHQIFLAAAAVERVQLVVMAAQVLAATAEQG
jgi:hypothetical protein